MIKMIKMKINPVKALVKDWPKFCFKQVTPYFSPNFDMNHSPNMVRLAFGTWINEWMNEWRIPICLFVSSPAAWLIHMTQEFHRLISYFTLWLYGVTVVQNTSISFMKICYHGKIGSLLIIPQNIYLTYFDLYWSKFNEIDIKMLSRNKADHV